MPPSLRTLLALDELSLRLLVDETALPAGAIDVAIPWAHSSDLLDPAPFLDPGHVLLTTGTQFGAETSEDEPERFAGYVERLRDAGIAALGFGTEVVRDGTPAALIDACRRDGLPLFEVPYRVPFIRVARTLADLNTAEANARQAWALQAQRAISLAALRPDGLGATLTELARRLDAWVGLVDASGALDRESPQGALPQPALGEVVGEARSMLRRAQRASRTLEAGTSAGAPHRVTLQTLGAGGALRGVLAIGDSPQLDQAGREVVTSVIALAGLALEQNRDLDRARGHLRSGLLRSILAGDLDLAADVAAEMWGALPEPPLRVIVADVPGEHADRLAETLELRAAERGGRLFFGRDGDTVVALAEVGGGPAGAQTGAPAAAQVGAQASAPTGATTTDAQLAEELAADFGVSVGLSDEVAEFTAVAIGTAHEQALRALERAREREASVVAFDEISRQGVLAFLARTDARAVARATLAPLADHDAEHGTALVETVRLWLEHGGQFDRAAQALGVHRHTVRGRIGLAERLLARDLSGFHARADLWAALLASD